MSARDGGDWIRVSLHVIKPHPPAAGGFAAAAGSADALSAEEQIPSEAGVIGKERPQHCAAGD